MPYADSGTGMLPYAPLSETSHSGAEAGRDNAESRRDTMAWHYRRNAFSGVADFEMVRLTGYPINVVCARRSDLGCVAVGKITGPCGVTVNTWALPTEDV